MWFSSQKAFPLFRKGLNKISEDNILIITSNKPWLVLGINLRGFKIIDLLILP